MVIRSPHPDVRIPDVSLYDFLFASLQDADLDRVAVIDGPSGAETTYRALRAQVDAIAGAFAGRGLAVGDVVALHSPNVPAFVSVFHGLLRAGITVTTIDQRAGDGVGGRQAARRLRCPHAGDGVAASRGRRGGRVVGGPRRGRRRRARRRGRPSFARRARRGRPPGARRRVRPRDPPRGAAVLVGHHGPAEGRDATHRNLVANVLQTEAYIPLTADDVIPAVLPFFHIYGMTVLMNGAVYQRSTLVTLPRFDLAEYLRVVEQHRATVLFVAPPIALALAKHPAAAGRDLSGVRMLMSGAAPFDEQLAGAVAGRLPGARVLQGYGMSEMSPVSHVVPIDRPDVSAGSVGLLVPNMLAKVVDPATGEEIPLPDEGVSAPGELLCAGPNVMVGYLADEQSTRDTLEPDGFLHTGDVVTVDAGGVFHVVDRLKELIKHKGYQVAPAELEALLLSHPEIADAAVIGVPDPEAGEVPKAFVVRAGGSALTADDVQSFVAERVAPYKKVRAVEFVDAVPKSAAGKILRKELRAR
ncbi:AMP-binding protein [Isoptericola hypogeus]|uniref:AMP-binding protein n=1 Tax=Isoptericola hypogeus TaxID=300179 RepID=UPI003CD05ACD